MAVRVTGEFRVRCNVQTNNLLGRTGGAGLILQATRNDFRASSTSQVNLKNSMFSLCGRRPLHKIGCPKPRFPEASHGQVSSHVDHHRSLKSSIPELSEKYWVDRCAVSPKRAISYALEIYILLQTNAYYVRFHHCLLLLRYNCKLVGFLLSSDPRKTLNLI